jgi:hypothetical protein
MVLLVLAGAVFASIRGVEAQDDDPYPVATLQDNFSYPAPTETPRSGTQPTLTPTVTSQFRSTNQVISTPTPNLSITPAPDVYSTENAQIGDSFVTPPASPTPAPSITLASTPTIASSVTSTSAAGVLSKSAAKGGFTIDWGFFVIGFVIPVLAGCGAVLYLLDHRPELFAQRRKS